MKRKYSPRYFDSIYESKSYEHLAELASVVSGSASSNANEATRGLPHALFLFVEDLLWFAQAIRSGVWTYFEATSIERQRAMLSALEELAPLEYAAQYSAGMLNWKDMSKISLVDRWIEENDEKNNQWLWRLATKHRTVIEEICA